MKKTKPYILNIAITLCFGIFILILNANTVYAIDKNQEPKPFFDTMDSWLTVSTDCNVVLEKLGEPQKGKEYLEACCGYVQSWNYPEKGIFLEMLSENKNSSNKYVWKITLKKPCKMKTSRGIKVGSTENQVIKKYSKIIDKELYKKGKHIILGNPFERTIFNIEKGKVKEIFIGQVAE